jgi:hypothetical protein
MGEGVYTCVWVHACVCTHDLYMRNLHFIFVCVYLIAFRLQGDYVYKVCFLPKYYLCE